MSAETSKINVTNLSDFNRLKLPAWESEAKFSEYATPVVGTTILLNGAWKTWTGSKYTGI